MPQRQKKKTFLVEEALSTTILYARIHESNYFISTEKIVYKNCKTKKDGVCMKRVFSNGDNIALCIDGKRKYYKLTNLYKKFILGYKQIKAPFIEKSEKRKTPSNKVIQTNKTTQQCIYEVGGAKFDINGRRIWD